MLRFGSYVRAVNTDEALEVLRYRRGAKVLGGGMWMRLSRRSVPCMIDLGACGLDTIDETEGEFSIGAMVTLRQLECDEAFNQATCGVFRDAVHDIVGVQFRNTATVGGSVFGRFGFSDVLCALMALDCEVELTGEGRMPLSQFAQRGYGKDLLERVYVRKHDYRASYECLRKAATDFPTCNVSAAQWDGAWHVAVGARPAPAKLVAANELGLVSDVPSADELGQAIDAVRNLRYSSNMWGSERYRRHLAGVLCARAVCGAAGIDVPAELDSRLVPAAQEVVA